MGNAGAAGVGRVEETDVGMMECRSGANCRRGRQEICAVRKRGKASLEVWLGGFGDGMMINRPG